MYSDDGSDSSERDEERMVQVDTCALCALLRALAQCAPSASVKPLSL